MESYCLLLAAASLLLLCCLQTSHGNVLFSGLPQTLTVTASPTHAQVVKAGEDIITITWGLNHSFSEGTDSSYNKIKLKLCYAPISQTDRGWRKTEDNLFKDKTCQFTIAHKSYTKITQNLTWKIEKDVPTATYFVRAYAYNSLGIEIAYGQSTDREKRSKLFKVEAISGRNTSIDVAAVCFSAFSLLSAIGFFVVEKKGRSVGKN